MSGTYHKSLRIIFTTIMLQVTGLCGQIIYNGDFNMGGLSCTGPPGWVTNNNVQVANNYQLSNNWIDITGCISGNGNWIEQEVSVTPGTIYFLRMDLGTWSGWDDEDAGVDITIDGQPLGSRIFNDSFTHDLNMKLCWVTGLVSCPFIAQKNKVKIRITGNGKCTKTSPQRACLNPYPGVMAIDNVILDSIQIRVPDKICLGQGKAKLWFDYIGQPMKYTCEWLLNGLSVSKDSAFEATQAGVYTLRVELPCQRVERSVQVGAKRMSVQSVNMCEGDSSFILGKYRYAEGDYDDTVNVFGDCDSIARVELRIISKPAVKLRDSIYYLCDLKNESIYLDAGFYQFYKWYPGGETTQWKKVNKTGTYWVTVGDNALCRDSVQMKVMDNCDLTCFIPNAFSPNGDGSNDFFPPSLNGISDYYFEVFNRWGELLYRSQDYLSGWNGYYKNELCHQGVYLYTIKFTVNSTRKAYNFSGTFTLLR